MNIIETQHGAVRVLALHGRLDATNSATAEEQLLAVVRRSTETQFVLDLAELHYLSSAGLRALLLVAKEIKAHSGQVICCAASDYVQEIWEIVGFGTVIPRTETRAEALQWLVSLAPPSTTGRDSS